MFIVKNEKEFMDAFRPRDRQHVEVPSGVVFPQFIRDYLAWTDEHGVRTFVLFTAPGEKAPIGLAFRRDQSRGDRTSRMCEWCHAYGTSDQIGLLTTDVNSRKRVGVSLCLDLDCGRRIEEEADRAGKNARELARRMLERMAKFTQEALGISAENRG